MPSTTPSIPIGYSASETATLTASEPSASVVGSHGRWSEKNVRVRIRFQPENGSEIANTDSASVTRSVDSASNSPRW